jgi:hypothetical protein
LQCCWSGSWSASGRCRSTTLTDTERKNWPEKS